MLKKWNLALVIGAWLLSIFGTFITRSGVIASVHSFTQSSVGYFFLAFLVLAAAGTIILYLIRLPLLKADAKLESVVSREASFLFNNLLFLLLAFSVLWGTLFPILSEWIVGVKYTYSVRTFNPVTIPLRLLLPPLPGIGPPILGRRAPPPTLERQSAGPATGGVPLFLMLLLGGMRAAGALMGIARGGFVTAPVVQEFVRGPSPRPRQYGEPY